MNSKTIQKSGVLKDLSISNPSMTLEGSWADTHSLFYNLALDESLQAFYIVLSKHL